MKPRDKRNWQPGDKVRLLVPITRRYSGYGGRPKFMAVAGTLAVVRSGPWPAVTGRERDFYNADVPDWPEGIAIWNKEAVKIKS